MSTSRQCQSCKSVVLAEAVKCPNCGEWREDVKRERDWYYIWLGLSGFPALFFLIGFILRWWANPRVWFSWFDFGTFFSSSSGLLILVTGAATLAVAYHYYASVSKKMGTLFWQ